MKYLSDYTEEAKNEVFKRNGVFFAFSNVQFKKGCEEVDATKENKLVDIGHGCYCLSKNEESFFKEMDEIHASGVERDIKENGIKKIILRELENYETQITGE